MAHRVETLAEGVTCILGDCRDVIPTLEPVAMVMTSPPYDGIRDYGDGFLGIDCLPVISLLADRLLPGGVIVWNVADQTVDGSETGTSFRQALHAKACGLRLHDTMIYCKERVSFPDANRYHPAFEYMFVFSNGAPSVFDGIRDYRNKWAGTKIHGTERERDGSTSKKTGSGSDIPEYGLRRNWWVVNNAHSGEAKGHPAPMPYSIAYDHIATWTRRGDEVLDPFLGSGTSGVAAIKQGRRFVGIELDAGYFDIACKRIEQALRQPDFFVEQPAPKAEQLSILDGAA